MIGEPVRMIDARERVSGTLEYVLNIEPPGVLHAAVARSDRAHARVRSIDVGAALAVPGVRAVLTRDDFSPGSALEPFYGPVVRDQPVVALDRVRYVGEPVAAVAADDPETAVHAASQVEVEYDELPPVFTIEDALSPGAPALHDASEAELTHGAYVTVVPVRDLGGNIGNHFRLRRGDVEAGLAAADEVFEATYESPPAAHVPMEPHVAIAHFDGDRLDVWSSTQTPYAVRHELAMVFRLPVARVRVRVPAVGGGYGAKVYAKIEPLTAAVAWKARRPVKLVLSRAEDFIACTKHGARIRLRTGVRRDGTFTAREVEAHFNAGAYSDISPRLITNAGAASPGPYRIPNVSVDSYAVFTNTPPAGALRGFGVTQVAWAYESQLDEIADRLRLDPVELRMRNLLDDGDRYATGERLEGFELKRTLADAANRLGWGTPLESPADGSKRRGRGVAAIMKATVTPSTSTALLKVNRDASVQALVSTVDIGQGARTVLAQIVAESLGVPLDKVVVVDPDTDVTPFDQTTSSSRSTYSMGEALKMAASDIRRQLLELGSKILGVPADQLELQGERVRSRTADDDGIAVSELLVRSQAGNLLGTGTYITVGGLDPETGQGIGSVHWHQGAGAAEVEVDLETGKVEVLRYHSSVFAGRVVNPLTAELQVQGSALFGLGEALYEEMVYDGGQLVNGNLGDYTIPALGDVPRRLTASLLESRDRDELHGIGETSLPPVMPAIANAVADAVGVRIRSAPMTPERVQAALAQQAPRPPVGALDAAR